MVYKFVLFFFSFRSGIYMYICFVLECSGLTFVYFHQRCLKSFVSLSKKFSNTMPRTIKTRNIPCSVPGCTKTFSNRGGLKNHLRVHRIPRQRLPRSPVPEQHFNNDSRHPSPIAGGSRHESEHMDTADDGTSYKKGERVRYHPLINGTHFLFLFCRR